MTADASGERRAAIGHANRARGQVAGLAGMIAADRAFPEIAQQLLAARGSLDSLLIRLVELELGDCVPSPAVRGEVDDLLRTALGRTASGRIATRSRRRRLAESVRIARRDERTCS